MNKIDDWILAKFQQLAMYVNVVWTVNICTLLFIISVLVVFSNPVVAAILVLIQVMTALCTNLYIKQKEGTKNVMSSGMYHTRLMSLSLLILIPPTLFTLPLVSLMVLLDIITVYLISTDKLPKPPKKKAVIDSFA